MSAGGVKCRLVKLDDAGICPDQLQDARVVHISPNHHFPTGLVTPMKRRRELLRALSRIEAEVEGR